MFLPLPGVDHSIYVCYLFTLWSDVEPSSCTWYNIDLIPGQCLMLSAMQSTETKWIQSRIFRLFLHGNGCRKQYHHFHSEHWSHNTLISPEKLLSKRLFSAHLNNCPIRELTGSAGVSCAGITSDIYIILKMFLFFFNLTCNSKQRSIVKFTSNDIYSKFDIYAIWIFILQIFA